MSKCILFVIFILHWSLFAQGQNKTYAENQIAGLEKALTRYQNVNPDSWMYLSCDPCIRKGDTSDVVALLETNLLLTGDLKDERKTDTNFFDETIHKSLIRFQQRNGLVADGVLGPQTIEALNVPVFDRIQQIENAIEQWKMFGEKISEPYILINLPDYSLQIIDSGRVTRKMKVIIGKQTTKTPVFQSMIKYLVINPDWVVPHSIASKEILPMLQKDPEYIARNHMEVFTFYKGSKVKVAYDSVDWKKVPQENFRYQIEQTPGPWNVLGQVKFIFPNEYNIYLHDTSEKYLFSHPVRTYSHGCIRIEKPLDLAAWLLNTNPLEIEDLLVESESSSIINLPVSVPVAIDYFTTWVDTDSSLQFREDIYNYQSGGNFNSNYY
jgi:L,D-transpeptidase YcbB